MIAGAGLGRIAGVPIGVNWSVLVLALLIAGALSEGTLPDTYPGYPNWAYDLTGVLAAVIFLVGLVAHELSHAIVANRNGFEVRRITLWMLGGVADVRGVSPGPGAEARIFAVGPLVSLLVGAFVGGVAAVLALAGLTGLVTGVLTWLAVVHLAIAALNLLPAAPLDGGRILRAALWRWRGDRTQANLTVAWVGRGLGTAVIALGLVALVRGSGLGAVWLALLGWFMLAAASTEEYRTNALETLSEVPVREVMTAQPQTVPPDASVADFLDHYVIRRGHNAFPLTEDGQPVALVTLDRVRQVPPERRGDTTMRQVACPRDQFTFTTPDEPVSDLLPRLNGCAEGRALVMSDGHLVGIVSSRDISRTIQRRAP
ncbi:site-2 protease family protein [Phytohabitans maris]|uniref:site-2 protease family protein n=1 Tax=Phytohabitans maris TaxID=3071409 RepID=UPI003D162F91